MKVTRQHRLTGGPLALWLSVALSFLAATELPAALPLQTNPPAAQAQTGVVKPAGVHPAANTNTPAARAALPALSPHEATFGLNRVDFLQYQVAGYPLWQYLASLLWVLLAFVAGSVVEFLIGRELRKLAALAKAELIGRILEVAQKPLKLAIIVVLLKVGIETFQWPQWTSKLFGGLFALTLAVTLTSLAVRLVHVILEHVKLRKFEPDTQFARLMLPLLGKSLKAFVVIIAALTTAQYLGLPITSVVAGLGIGGIAVALAAQSTLANIFGTLTLLVDRPFRAGDRVIITNYDGTVEGIGLRSTRIRTQDGHMVTIPNHTVADAAIKNLTVRPTTRHVFTLGLTYDTTARQMQQALDILRAIFGRHPLTHDSWVHWRTFGDNSLDIEVVYWCKSTNRKAVRQAMEEINFEIKRRFEAAGLEFAFPSRTIYLRRAEPASREKDAEPTEADDLGLAA